MDFLMQKFEFRIAEFMDFLNSQGCIYINHELALLAIDANHQFLQSQSTNHLANNLIIEAGCLHCHVRHGHTSPGHQDDFAFDFANNMSHSHLEPIVARIASHFQELLVEGHGGLNHE